MNLKAVALIFLVVFAATATLYMAGISSSQRVNDDVSYRECNIIQVDEDLVEPQKEIDTPGMPT